MTIRINHNRRIAVERSVINDESLVKCTMTALQSGLAKAWSWASRSALLRFEHFFATHICILPVISQPSYVAMYMWFSKYTRSQSKHWNMCLRLHNSAGACRNQQNDMCAQRRLISSWEFALSNQSFHCPPEERFGPPPQKSARRRLIRLGWPEPSLGA